MKPAPKWMMEIVDSLSPEGRERIIAEGRQRRLERERKLEAKAAKKAVDRERQRAEAEQVLSAITERAPPPKKVARRM